MTANELIVKLQNEYGITKKWPDKYEVDAETYSNCCNFIFQYQMSMILVNTAFGRSIINIAIGPNQGLMFKNIELILKT